MKGLDVFSHLYGVPTVVFYRAELWDAHLTFQSNVSEHRGIIQQFVNDTTTTFLALRTHLPPTTLLATHTIPVTNWGGIIHLRYSSALRYIAKSNDILLIDWQHLVTDASLQNYLRDEHHPTPALCISLGFFMLRIANKFQYEIEACDKWWITFIPSHPIPSEPIIEPVA